MQPRLSVVVSIRNTAEYLTECLESIAGQTLSCVEAVLVDDGSTDDSPRIAEDFATRDPRFRLVRQQHAGLSAARNRGVRETPRTVEFLAFANGDDVLPHDAYARLIASLDTTGSAFAAGNVWQLGRYGRRQEPAYHWLTESRPRTHITRTPRLLADRTARNKVFRRAFWNRHALSFPEGRQYASTRVTIPAHFLAGSVDLLREHVSYQRARQGAGAALHADAKAVRDRIAACEHISRFLSVQQPAHREAYDASCLRGDLVPFLEALPSAGRAYREAFLAAAPDFVAHAAPAALDGLPAGLRVKWHLVRERRLPELLDLLTSGPGCDTAFRVRGRLLRHGVFPHPGGADGGEPAAARDGRAGSAGERSGGPDPLRAPRAADVVETVTRLSRDELDGVARVRETTWDDAGRLVVRGYAYIRNLEAATPGQSARTGVLTCARDQGLPGVRGVPGVRGIRGIRGVPRVRLVATRSVLDPGATADSGQVLHCYDHAGFEMTVDLAKLRVRGRWTPGRWTLGVLVAGRGTVRHAPLRALDAATAQWTVRDLDEDREGGRLRLELGFEEGGLTLGVVECPARVEGHHRDGADVVFVGQVYAQGVEALRLSRPDGPDGTGSGSGMVIEAPLAPEDGRFALRVPLAQLAAVPPPAHRAPKEVPPPCTEPWRAELVMADGSLAPPAALPGLPPGRYALADGRELCATADDRGRLRVELTRRPIADTLFWADDGTLTISGTVGAAGARARTALAGGASGPFAALGAFGAAEAELVLRHEVLDEEVTVPLVRTAPQAPPSGAAASGADPSAAVPEGDASPADLPPVDPPSAADNAPETEAETEAEGEAEGEGKAKAGTEAVRGAGTEAGGEEAAEAGTDTGAVPANPAPAAADPAQALPAPFPSGPGARFSATLHPAADVLGEGRWYAFVRERAPEPGTASDAAPADAPATAPPAGTTAATGTTPAPGSDTGSGTGTGTAGAGAPAVEFPLRVLGPLAAALPARYEGRDREFTVQRRHGDHLVVEAGSALPAAERGAYRRHRLRTTHYPRRREEPLRDAVLYAAGRGDDSLRAVHEELVRRGSEVEHLWVTRDLRTHVPPAARAVVEHSAAWYEALARSRRIIACDHLPDFFERRDGQTVVQTWHGVPLKRIGADLAGSRFADHAHVEALPRLVAQWSVLVVPNRFAIGPLTRALGYDGELLQAGAPRNDVLFAADRDKTAERVRAELGIEPGRRVVLYAPTYRDHHGRPAGAAGPAQGTQGPDGAGRTGSGAGFRYAYEPAFDFRAAERALGDDHVLLVRRHPLAWGRLPGARAPFVRDVTHHPRTGELLLIADVLVTDYSSLMFDFAHTGRPMLFHTYDLEHYRDTVRGFTLDFEARAPGPLLTSTDEVLAALRGLDMLAERHTDAYAAFRDAYCDLDDGHAAARVADRLLR
ncbi:CDP-glycerol glycerophosphotransferase family protein [Streptomyces sulfonofaciens]|uniref:CDP-glycerol glycerophosphotransferase family protein n=1 Tax=Streptomyces sulfonofaciens TaxID=68272 RepID=UPI0016787BCE|nr:CDP-glycerol glycerophosphotransferase family protein [Streptomyces sulfonofaciens]